MATNETVVCKYLYAPPPQCDMSYAQVIGSEYDSYEAAYIVISVIVTVVSLGFAGQLFHKKGFKQLDLQRKFMILSLVICFTLILRTPDPQGFRRRLPIAYVQFLTEVASVAVYSITFLLVFDWMRIILKVSGRGGDVAALFRYMNGLHLIVWTIFPIFGSLQVSVEEFWIFRVVKFAVGLVCLAFVQTMLIKYGLNIYTFLRKQEMAQQQAKAVNSEESEMSGQRSKTFVKRKSKIGRILKLIVIASFFLIFTMVFQLVAIGDSLSSKPTLSQPQSPPKNGADVAYDGIFNIIFWIVPMLVNYFYRYREAKEEDEPSRSHSSSSTSKKPLSSGSSMKMEAQKARMGNNV